MANNSWKGEPTTTQTFRLRPKTKDNLWSYSSNLKPKRKSTALIVQEIVETLFGNENYSKFKHLNNMTKPALLNKLINELSAADTLSAEDRVSFFEDLKEAVDNKLEDAQDAVAEEAVEDEELETEDEDEDEQEDPEEDTDEDVEP